MLWPQEAAQSCLTLWDPVDCNLPGSSVHGILQARVLEWFPFHSPMRCYMGDLLFMSWPLSRSRGSVPLVLYHGHWQLQQDILLWHVDQDPKDSKEPPLYALGTQVLIKVWKDGSPKAQLQSTWKGPYPVILSTPTIVKVPGHNSWIHHSWVKQWKKTEEDI